ncbi:MAG: hypothetical protein A3F04_02000 [Candidatus Chisholmbacteria bacterium RIFCSPHIGHO2_12_FULL_49_9]|uniref:Methyltransferase type 11 domain-containing protein n=1 Tax=Candidatus Chisholmbacteria bacterium RIFCSPHIGHO2_01_FULL_52_32 TaxID=1797591 RepID=A0A1G1VSY7_9BACT|nr:MAG: hypothetical protein A2786_03320 [Candidatus Chisholmbacteria bacterium RIFCSPHIGHO2_01_FULL_52_32]OGY19206.1 MAG: hypothetical protein A3F04_02000 [Candidatus Chisholmbacteria bacterium RIFCSPHIGHO2_12_FULL_49_9]OGY20127.1 MAG: hypothetical protein A2900_03425 [Candidatus Chisholmbacteria bacterium RIFCSPLOWO2_01_FULL_50_28]
MALARLLAVFTYILKKLNFLDLRVYSLAGFSSEKKFDYQRRYIKFRLTKDARVLDVGSGGEPFPYATYLVDLYPGKTQHRYNELKTNRKPLIQASVEHLPFKRKSIDFAYCAHVLEHVDDPARACEELMRVGKRGYIEVPTRLSDIIFNFTKIPNFHRWYVNRAGNSLIFVEYSDYERRDTRCNEFYQFAHSRYDNPLRRMFRRNKDLITNMFMWDQRFSYYVFSKDGELLSRSTNGI